MKANIWCFVAIVLTLAVTVFATDPGKANFHILRKIPIGGQGGWDYVTVDSDAHRLYVSHATQVEVVDLETSKKVATIFDTPGVHGVALVPGGERGYISNGKAATVTVFDKKTLAKVVEIKVGNKPDAIIFDPTSSRIFVFNGGDATSTAIGTTDNKAKGTVKLGASPEFAVADGNGYVFNNSEDESVIFKFKAKSLTVEQRWPLAPCKSPSSLDMDRKNHRLFVGCRNKLMVVLNSDTGKVITSLPIGDHVDATAFDEQEGLIFNSNGEGNITVIGQNSPDDYAFVQTIQTFPRSKTFALDRKTHLLYVPALEDGNFEVLVIGK